MAETQKIGRVTFRRLTNEEALRKYGSSFVFVGSRPASLEQAAGAEGEPAVKRLAEDLRQTQPKTKRREP
jgi:hypothetical protein